LPLKDRELAPDPQELARRLKRARIVTVGNRSNEDLVDALGGEPQSLVIVNSRKHALELYQQAEEQELPGLVHLTTRMCAAHRAKKLSDIRQRLKDQQDCRVIATSLVEAGVDFDFPSVWRAEAGLDSLVQAAGRCNREGKRPLDSSIVKVFTAPDYPPPREIKSLIGDMSRMMAAHSDDLSSLDAIRSYFQEVYWRLDEKGLDAENILGLFRLGRAPDFSYRTAAERFRMIECGLAPVIIPYDGKAEAAIREIAVDALSSGGLARRLQRHVVQVPPKARARLIANGKAAFASPEFRGDQFCVLQDMGLYKPDTGLLWEDADYLSIEESLW
jgi:CRISPR-associated endonuclease/helicase Cas3